MITQPTKITELDVVDTHDEFGTPAYGKVIGQGTTSIHTCDSITRDIISIEQGDCSEPDMILLFGREAIESLRDVLTLHLEVIDRRKLEEGK